MPIRTTTYAGSPIWLELFTSNAEQSQAFYTALFGWSSQQMGPDFGNYINFAQNGERVAGGMHNGGESGQPDGWSVYLQTDDAERTAADAATHGGGVIVPVMPVMDLGVMAVMTDASHAAIGAWQPGTHTGYITHGEPGAPAWFELMTRDFDGAMDFYRDVFKWQTHVMSDTDEFRYATLGDGASAAAGIMDASGFLPDGVPSHWVVYFEVADTDAACAKIIELGGSVLDAPQDTPFGRNATVADSTGAMFKLTRPNSN